LNSGKHSKGIRPLLTLLSLGLVVLGIGCVSWAAFSIWSQSDEQLNRAHSRVIADSEGEEPRANMPSDLFYLADS